MLLRQCWCKSGCAIHGPQHDVAVWLVASMSICEVWLSMGKRRVCCETTACLIVNGSWWLEGILMQTAWSAAEKHILVGKLAFSLQSLLPGLWRCPTSSASTPWTTSPYDKPLPSPHPGTVSRKWEWQEGCTGKDGTGIAWDMGGHSAAACSQIGVNGRKNHRSWSAGASNYLLDMQIEHPRLRLTFEQRHKQKEQVLYHSNSRRFYRQYMTRWIIINTKFKTEFLVNVV